MFEWSSFEEYRLEYTFSSVLLEISTMFKVRTTYPSTVVSCIFPPMCYLEFNFFINLKIYVTTLGRNPYCIDKNYGKQNSSQYHLLDCLSSEFIKLLLLQEQS